MAQRHPGTVGGLSALLLASTRAPKTVAGKEANQQLARQIETAEIGNLAAAFDRGVVGRWQAMQNLAPVFLARVRRSPDQPKSARLLAAICSMTRPNEDENPPAIYTEAANLIADEYASSPDISHFCEGLRKGALWTVQFERHLRAILQANQDRWVRCSAQLACIVQSITEDRQTEAATLFEQFLTEFDGKHSYPAQGIEVGFRSEAKDQLVELRSRAVGMPAPDIAGFDLDDKPMKLSDYRGRAVLLHLRSRRERLSQLLGRLASFVVNVSRTKPPNDPAQQRRGPSGLRTWESQHAPAVCCSVWFGGEALR